MNENEDIEAARAAYALVKPSYERLAAEIRYILETKLAEAGLIPASITYRPKAIESFAEKIARKHYDDPLSQMTDLAGVRVVCAYESELAKVAEVIEGNFEVRERIDKARDLGIDRMGYNGKAFVVTMGSRYAGGRYENITDLACEIQVRTILQDAWAIIDHQLVYKNEESTPERLRRDLNNVASLLEIAQGIFDSVKEKRVAYVTEIQHKKEHPPTFLAQPLDLDTVMAYTRWKFPNREASEMLTQILLRDINPRDYPTLQQLDRVVCRARAAVEAYQKENPDWFKTGTDFLTKSLGFADPNFRAKHGFAAKTRAAFDKFQGLVAK
jgi:ppGpp synthetase/RelA/SpoT-type nucleotidyltranferase